MTSRRADDAARIIAQLVRRVEALERLKSRIGHTHGQWQDWTPTLTNVTLGNGIQTARFAQIDKTVHLYYSLDFGTTTTMDGSPLVSLPVTAALSANDADKNTVGVCSMVDASGSHHLGQARIRGSSDNIAPFAFVVSGSGIVGSNLSGTVPFTWATDDRLTMTATYEAV